MPIGKNSIKRVTNNGYSNVLTEAPDMENSVIEAEKKEKAISTPKVKQTVKKTVTKATAVKKTTRDVSNRKPAVRNSTPPTNEEKKADGVKETASYVNLGRDLPAYLL